MKYIGGADSIRSQLSHKRVERLALKGQTLVEYALILAIISIVAVGVMINLGKATTGVYSMITSNVASAQASH